MTARRQILKSLPFLPSLAFRIALSGLLSLTNKDTYFKFLLEVSPLFCEAGNEGFEKRCRQDPKTSARGRK